MRPLCLLSLALTALTLAACPPPEDPPPLPADASVSEAPDAGALGRAFIRTPFVRQATDFTCGPAALASVLYFYGDEIIESELADELGTTEEEGTRSAAMVAYARRLGYHAEARTGLTVEDLKGFIDAGRPTLVLLQAWRSGSGSWATDWEDGHFAVVTGYDEQRLYFMDPSTTGNYTFVDIPEFLDRWHDWDGDTKVHHLAVLVWKERPTYDPEEILPMR